MTGIYITIGEGSEPTNRKNTRGPVKRGAAEGDPVYFLIGREFVAKGRISSDREYPEQWGNSHKIFRDIADIQKLKVPVPLSEIARAIPGWKWCHSMQPIQTSVPDEFVEAFLNVFDKPPPTPKKQFTIFTWGYYGWGNHTPDLVRAVDAVERSRGFKPPLFVDTRIRRSVRATGFNGTAFEKLLGPSRHRWMKSLGNEFVLTGIGPNPKIAEPAAANDLLDLAIEIASDNRRLLFFCSCQWPGWKGKNACHRSTVADLVVKAARKRDVKIQIVEWPGGEPQRIELNVSPEVFSALERGRLSIPLGTRPDLGKLAGLPWGSIATLRAKGESLQRIVGPAISQTDQWVLPVQELPSDRSARLDSPEKEAASVRKFFGLNAKSA